jgi:hypothetical protein
VLDAEAQFAANLEFLKHHPVHYQMYQNVHAYPLCNVKLLPAPTGALYGEAWDIASQQWIALCHPEDPIAQATASCDQFYTPQARVFCMVGLGLGYNAVEFAKRLKPYQKLCIWDVDPQLVKAMMYATDIAPLFSMPNVNLIVGNDVVNHVERWWMQLQVQDKLYIQMPMRDGYTGGYLRQQYEALMLKTIDMLRFHAVGCSTWKLFGRHIGENDLENMPEYFATPGFEQITGLWQDKPAVCLAAGPSLQKNLAQLLPPAVRDRVALISAGTVYALAQGMGLAPDIVTTIDFQRLNWTDQFQYVPLDPDCTLVYLHSTYPQTIRRWPGPKFVAENSSDTLGWMRQYSEGKKSAAEVQTVAHLNLKVALELGANPIILLGQDLSMPPDTHHAAGARAQDQAPDETPPEAWITVPDYQGQPVQTRHSFLSMLMVFERLIAEHPETTVYNCSEGGLPIKGAIHKPLAEVLALLDERAKLLSYGTPAPLAAPSLREQCQAKARAYQPVIKDTLYDDLKTLSRQVDDLGRFADEMLALEEHRLRIDVHTLSAEQRQAVLSSGAMSLLETVESLQSDVDGQIMAYEGRILGERPHAWGLFAIRRFDFIELISEIPPPPDAVAREEAQRRFNANRLLRIAAMIKDEYPRIARLLRLTLKRLPGCMPGFDYDTCRGDALPRYAAQGHHQAVRRGLVSLRDPFGVATPVFVRHLAQYLYHTQQYEAALALLDTWRLAPAKAARIRQRLAAYRESCRTVWPVYVTPRPVSPAPVNPWHALLY